MVKMGKDEWKN